MAIQVSSFGSAGGRGSPRDWQERLLLRDRRRRGNPHRRGTGAAGPALRDRRCGTGTGAAFGVGGP
ncbi:MAG TPA: hypothetical protein VIX15_07535 [Streptosporangiaceae bacterium]